HGTNDDASIGTELSHGCIRMHNADIQQLVPVLPLQVPVTIV
ncbi:L,D-transpeptidase, partial [uncultured Sphingorhabdus sp.]